MIWGSIAAFYVFMIPYTKVEESFNVQVPFPFPSFGFRVFVLLKKALRICIAKFINCS